jgi:hypothetical protein
MIACAFAPPDPVSGSLFFAVVLVAAIGSPPAVESLVAATRRGDAVEIDRVARRLGAGRLARAIDDPSVDVRRAALGAAPRVEDAWTLLPAILARAVRPGEPTAAEALVALRRILQQIDLGSPQAPEIPGDTLRGTSDRLAAFAVQPGVALSLRVQALAIVALLAPAAPPPRAPLRALLTDGAPQVRRAAADAWSSEVEAVESLGDVAARDERPEVAAAAAAAICRRALPLGRLSSERLRALAAGADVDPADAIELLGCLVHGGAADRASAADIARRHPSAAVRASLAREP